MTFDPTNPDHAYYLGHVTALCYLQADLDTKDIQKPVLVTRLPDTLPHDFEKPFDVKLWEAAVDYLNEEAAILSYHIEPIKGTKELRLELTSSEGYLGTPEWFGERHGRD